MRTNGALNATTEGAASVIADGDLLLDGGLFAPGNVELTAGGSILPVAGTLGLALPFDSSSPVFFVHWWGAP